MNALMTKIEWAAIEAEFGKQIKVKDAPILEAVQRISKKYKLLAEVDMSGEEHMGTGAKQMIKDYLAEPGTVKTLWEAVGSRFKKGQPVRAILTFAVGAIIKLCKGFLQILHATGTFFSGDGNRFSRTDDVSFKNFLYKLGIVGSVVVPLMSMAEAAMNFFMDNGFLGFYVGYETGGFGGSALIWILCALIYFSFIAFTKAVEWTYQVFDLAWNALVGKVVDALPQKKITAAESISQIKRKLKETTSETAISRGNFDKLYPGEKTFAQYHIDAYKLAIKYAKHAEREYQNGDYGDGKSNTKNGFSPKTIFDEADKHLDQLSKWFDEKTLKSLGVLPA